MKRSPTVAGIFHQPRKCRHLNDLRTRNTCVNPRWSCPQPCRIQSLEESHLLLKKPRTGGTLGSGPFLVRINRVPHPSTGSPLAHLCAVVFNWSPPPQPSDLDSRDNLEVPFPPASVSRPIVTSPGIGRLLPSCRVVLERAVSRTRHTAGDSGDPPPSRPSAPPRKPQHATAAEQPACTPTGATPTHLAAPIATSIWGPGGTTVKGVISGCRTIRKPTSNTVTATGERRQHTGPFWTTIEDWSTGIRGKWWPRTSGIRRVAT